MRRLLVLLVVLAVGLTAPLALGASSHDEKFTADLSGAAEVPDPGAPNGTGSVAFTLNEETGKACWTFSGLSGLEGKPLLAHIHKGKAGQAGDVVVPLGERYKRKGCVTANKAALRKITAKPGNYYANVHTDKYPAGVVRGQLQAA
jgi:hypothetical protein